MCRVDTASCYMPYTLLPSFPEKGPVSEKNKIQKQLATGGEHQAPSWGLLGICVQYSLPCALLWLYSAHGIIAHAHLVVDIGTCPVCYGSRSACICGFPVCWTTPLSMSTVIA